MDQKISDTVTLREDSRRALYLRQKHMLEGFLARGAISAAQFRKSLGDLTEKMGMEDVRAEDDACADRGKRQDQG